VELLLPSISLEIDGGNNLVANQDRQSEVSKQPLFLGHVSLEAVLVVEEQLQSLALVDGGWWADGLMTRWQPRVMNAGRASTLPLA
jgi:hypothetical protein